VETLVALVVLLYPIGLVIGTLIAIVKLPGYATASFSTAMVRSLFIATMLGLIAGPASISNGQNIFPVPWWLAAGSRTSTPIYYVLGYTALCLGAQAFIASAVFVCRYLFPSKFETPDNDEHFKQLSQRNTDAIVSALKSFKEDRISGQKCAFCNGELVVSRMESEHGSDRPHLKVVCSCGACNGKFAL